MRLEAMTDAEEARIHETALGILEDVGLAIDGASPAAGRLRDLGLRIPRDGRLVLPRALVESALRKAPRRVRLGARDPRRAATLDGRRTYVTTDGCGARTLDLESGERRPSTLEDVARSARLADALDRYDVYWTMVSAQDVPPASRVAREYLTAVTNTTKHVQVIDAARAEEAGRLAAMARLLEEVGAVQGPAVSLLSSVVSPLRLDPGGTAAALAFAGAGLPVAACSMPIASVTGPATAPGTVALAHAEILGMIAVIQALHPGAPVIYCSFPAFADPRTGTTNYRDPRRFWAAAAATQLGRRMNLPCFTSGEVASLLVGPDLLCFGGLLEVSTLLSFEQMVIDDEILRDFRLAAAPQEVDAETLALEVIRDVGPGGHFLARKHTVRHIREFVTSRYAEPDRAVDGPDRTFDGPDRALDGPDRTFEGPDPAVDGPQPAAGAGSAARPPDGPRDRARSEARRILESHVVPPLPERLESDLLRLVERPDLPMAG
jgi:trimethylamine--corrinoid protein Co-methyltransferase